jgi:hypothetical protein
VPGLERDAELAQLVLVPLEHAPEGLLGVLRVAGHRRADLLHGQVAPGVQQADHQVEQPLGLLRRHPATLAARRARQRRGALPGGQHD